MQKIPFFHNYDPNNKKLTLRSASYLPKEIFDFSDDIEILDASFGRIFSLPDNFAKLNKLKIAFFSNNLFEELPKVLFECKNLDMLGFKSCKISKFDEDSIPQNIRWLILTDNRIAKLPKSIGKLINLQKLSLAGNCLESLPDEILSCQKLELIRIAANNFSTQIPSWLFTLPHLAWYGDNGNEFNRKYREYNLSISNISWKDIEIGDLISESPSSHVFKGILKNTKQEIAVKIFKGELTSDGLPSDDIYASIVAGEHDNFIKILGKLDNHPFKKEGLVLSLVPSEYKKLGLPPDFNSCTRDTFPSNTICNLPFILNILKGISSACSLMHSKGLMHGDIYAHNILTDNIGKSFLCDFGAASFYDTSVTKDREFLDVRAFACLIEDLLNHSKKESDINLFNKLYILKESCINENVSKRPLFKEIFDYLLD